MLLLCSGPERTPSDGTGNIHRLPSDRGLSPSVGEVWGPGSSGVCSGSLPRLSYCPERILPRSHIEPTLNFCTRFAHAISSSLLLSDLWDLLLNPQNQCSSFLGQDLEEPVVAVGLCPFLAIIPFLIIFVGLFFFMLWGGEVGGGSCLNACKN